MGSKLSIDKHVSSLEDILSTDPALFSSIQVENNIPDCTTQNIKIWRYYEDDTKSKAIKSAPISLEDVLNADFTFVSNECYLVLFVYRKNAEDTLPFNAFPASMWGLVESYSNLTPRGLETPVASSEPISSLNKEVLESFLLPKRNQKQDGDKFEHMLFVWNGKTANPLMKAIALSKALEFDTLIHKGKDPLLQVLFSGGYIKNKKLCAGNILQLDSSVGNQQNQDLDNRIDPMKETIYLMKFLFPANDPRSFKPSAFKERFLSSRPSEMRQDDEYVMMGDFPMELEEESEFVEESTPLDSPTSMSYGGRRGSEFDDFLPLESVRRDMGPPAAVPKLTLSITKTQNGNDNPVGAIGGFGQLVNNGGDSKFKIPNLRLGRLGEEAVNVEIKVETPVSEDAANESQERSEEVRQPASSDRTSESQDSRRRSERRIANRVQMSNLSLGTIEQPRVSEANQMANLAEINRQIHIGNYGGRESAIRGERQEFFAGQCSEVLEGFLYVAGIKIASNIKKLEEFGITHVINAAGDVCENFFSDKIKYLTYYIKDHPSESIECVFYETLAFIENARQEGGRVLVHCVQGVSRSVTICMSYLMLKHQYTFNQAYKYIRDIRGIASPNPAFWAQLCHFYNRLYGAFDTIPAPRVFTIGSYQKETPQTLVARLLPDSHSLYGQKNTRLLDPRSVVILQAQHSLYLWVGNEILPANRERYIAKAEEHIKLLQQYEHAHPECLTIHCGEEPEEFWSLWENIPETRYGKNNDWNYWLVDLSAHKNVEGITIYEEQEEEDDSGEVEVVSTPSLFCYPKLEALKHADMDELSDEENLLVLCTEKENDKLVYVWRGANVPTNEIDNEAYIADVIKEKWPDTDAGEIKIFNEVPNQESNSFMDYFQ